MHAAILHRLGWQVPALLLLTSLLLPAWPWLSAWFGPWPLWLAAMPLTALGLARRDGRAIRPAAPPQRAQVLVFPAGERPKARAARAARRVA